MEQYNGQINGTMLRNVANGNVSTCIVPIDILWAWYEVLDHLRIYLGPRSRLVDEQN